MGKGKKDKVAKPVTEVKTKPDGSKKKKVDRKPTEEVVSKYRFIYPQFVKGAAEANGIPLLADEVALSLAEDVTYRLRTVVQMCSKYLKHSRHNRLKCEDVNLVFDMLDIPPIYGHGTSKAPSEFLAIREAGIFVPDDPQVNLLTYALEELGVEKQPALIVRGKWLMIEDQKNKTDENKSTGGDSARNQNPESNSRDIDGSDYEPKYATILIKYYAHICNSILGHTDLTLIFKDLMRNDKILQFVPSLLNFITITLNTLGTERQIMRLLQTINALADNYKLDFRPFHPTVRIASVLLRIIKYASLERKRDALLSLNPRDRTGATFQFSHSLAVRIKAAQILAKVSRRWCCSEDQIIQEMVKLVSDLTLPSRVHVGAVTVLKELGPSTLRVGLWSYLKSLLKHVETLKNDKQALEYSILEAARILYRFPHLTSGACPPTKELDRCLYEYYGDSLCPLWIIEPPLIPSVVHRKSNDSRKAIFVKGSWQLPKCINSMYNPMAKRQSIQMAFELPKIRKKRHPRIMFKFAGANPVPEMSLKRRRLDSRYSQFIAGKVSEGHVVLIGKYWRPMSPEPNYSIFSCASLYTCL